MRSVKQIAKELGCCVVLALGVVYFTGCASLTTGKKQRTAINSEPPGAKVLIDGKESGVTPTSAQFSRDTSHLVELSLEGYNYYEVTVEPQFNNVVYGNVLAGGIVGLMIDESSGASNTLYPKEINATLVKR